MKKIHHFMSTYRQTHLNRAFWVNPKWRLFIVLALMATMFLVRDYLENKYLGEFDSNPIAYAVLDKAMYWFGVGIIVGAAAIFLMFEGEFAIGVWNQIKRIERETFANMIRKVEKAHSVKKKRKR